MSDAFPDAGPFASALSAQLAAFTSDTRLYELETPSGAGRLVVESWVGKEQLSALYEWHISCLSTDTNGQGQDDAQAFAAAIRKSSNYLPIPMALLVLCLSACFQRMRWK